MVLKNLHDIRTNYKSNPLDEKKMKKCAIEEFIEWYEIAEKLEIVDPNAASLATYCSKTKRVRSRMILIKEISKVGFIFFSNYKSDKAMELNLNARAAMNIYWPSCSRQIRIEGIIKKVSSKISNTYFSKRPFESQLSAVMSKQSKESKDWLNFKNEFIKKLKNQKSILRPKDWGGYELVADYIEFWQGGEFRLHDRIAYGKSKSNVWEKKRLYP